MAFGKIPVLVLAFPPSEAMIAFRYLLQDGPNDDVVRNLNPNLRYIGAKHAVMVPSARYEPVFFCVRWVLAKEMKSSFPG